MLIVREEEEEEEFFNQGKMAERATKPHEIFEAPPQVDFMHLRVCVHAHPRVSVCLCVSLCVSTV